MLMEHGQRPAPNGPGDLLWGNTEAEYAGAVSFRRGEDERSAETGQGYARLSDEEIAQRLESATQAANAGSGRPRSYRERRTSLSGMRPKIGLTPLDGGWGAATGGSVNGCVAKVEMDPNGEAGMKAIAQRAVNCRLNADVTLAIVRDVAKRMPQALAQARTEARTEDENRFRAAVERRVEKTIRYSEGAGRDFEATLHRMHSKGARGQNERVRTAGAGPKAAREKMPEGRRRIHDDGEQSDTNTT